MNLTRIRAGAFALALSLLPGLALANGGGTAAQKWLVTKDDAGRVFCVPTEPPGPATEGRCPDPNTAMQNAK